LDHQSLRPGRLKYIFFKGNPALHGSAMLMRGKSLTYRGFSINRRGVSDPRGFWRVVSRQVRDLPRVGAAYPLFRQDVTDLLAPL